MQKLKIYIGDKNLSSWSMRPWLVLNQSGLKFSEHKILLDTPKTEANLKKNSPSMKVPVLQFGDLKIWDSLAICEFIAELAPDKNLWPSDPFERALARSYVSEMHSGFTSLRGQLSMDIRLRMKINHLSPATLSDIRRILSLWKSALKNSKGPFLFGEFGIVDAFYAPVVCRFISYGISIKDPVILKYMKTVTSQPHVSKWIAAAHKEKNQKWSF